MNVGDIIWTDKMRAVMADDAQVIFCTGATGCSKTLTAGHKFMEWIHTAPKSRTQFFILFETIGTGVRNFLQDNASFYNMFDFCRAPYRAGKEGGIQFVWHGEHGDKIVYILGADDKNSWGKILGSNPDGIWAEELSVLHPDCLREVMGRVFSRKCKFIGTTNGGLPTQEFYTEFVNHATVQFRDTVPALELSDMLEDKDYMHYYHFNMDDDAPHLDAVDRERLRVLYPTGSFYHYSKILGCRGFVEGAAYAQLMDRSVHIRAYDDINLSNVWEMALCVDIGSNRNVSDTSKASTVATLMGYSKGYQRMIAIECWVIPANSHDDIIRECERLIEPYWVKYMQKFEKIIIDSAEAILINTWQKKTKFNTITVKGAIKHIKDLVTLVSRCQLKQQLLLQQRLLWSTRAINSYNAHTRLMIDDDGSEFDLSVQDNDIADSLTYGLTEYWNGIVNQTRR